ncbi:hypothetical protein EJB05_10154, partial [Eragrostis curvula]
MCIEPAEAQPMPHTNGRDLKYMEDGRNGTFMIGKESFLHLSWIFHQMRHDDSLLIKTADTGRMILVREENDPASEGVEYKHGLTPPMRDARRRCFCREHDLYMNASVIGGEEGGDRKKAAAPRAAKPDVQEPAANDEEVEPYGVRGLTPMSWKTEVDQNHSALNAPGPGCISVTNPTDVGSLIITEVRIDAIPPGAPNAATSPGSGSGEVNFGLPVQLLRWGNTVLVLALCRDSASSVRLLFTRPGDLCWTHESRELQEYSTQTKSNRLLQFFSFRQPSVAFAWPETAAASTAVHAARYPARSSSPCPPSSLFFSLPSTSHKSFKYAKNRHEYDQIKSIVSNVLYTSSRIHFDGLRQLLGQASSAAMDP